MPEQMIEWAVEKMIDRLDARYMDGEFSEDEYKDRIKLIDEWASKQYDIK